jgi:hypothetical protein
VTCEGRQAPQLPPLARRTESQAGVAAPSYTSMKRR